MESTALSVGKSVLNGALGYANSALAEEVALQLGVQRDQAFIRDELEMMQSFLMAAHDERDEHKVIKTWVKQVRDVAYDVEDCLQDFAVRLEKQSWWRNPRTLRDRHRVAKQMKDLRAKVEDVSQRNVRYRIIQGSSGSKPTNTADQSSSSASATMFGIDEARRAAKQDKPKVDLVQLINKEDKDLRVIAVWGTSGDLGQTSIIKRAYDDRKICEKFECRAWIRLMHPFDPTEFMQSIMRQFYANFFLEARNIQEKATLSLRAQVLKNMGMIKQEDLIDKFIHHVDKKSFLIVLNGLLTIEDWDWIKMYFLNNKNGSRIIVSTEKVEVASLCAGQKSQVSELKQLSADQTIYVFCEKDLKPRRISTSLKTKNTKTLLTKTKDSQDGMDSTKAPGSSSNSSITSTNNSSTVPIGEILEEQSALVGRGKEKSEIIALISKDSQQVEVISVCGMGGLGKTTLVKDIYQSQELNGKFEKRACVTVMRPFSREEHLRSLVMQLGTDTSEKKDVLGMLGNTKKTSALNMELEDLIKELSKLLGKNRCLIVLDDLSSTTEWDLIITSFPEMENTSRIIVTTREENIAKHCSKKQENIYKLEGLQYKDAAGLFTKKDSQDGMDSTKAPGSSSNSSITGTNNSSTADGKKVVGKSLTRIETMVAAFSESELVGRVKEKSDIIALISKDSQQVEVISVCGMGGLGKTTLVKDIYQSQELNGKFEKRACATVMRPFSRVELLGSLVMQLGADTSEKDVLGMLGSTKKTSALNMGLKDLIKELSKLLEKKRCLIVLDDLSSTAEWDLIIKSFPEIPEMENTSRIIVTAREENIAKHCSKKQENIYKLEGLQYKDAVGLFTKKVFKETVDLVKQYPGLVEEAERILKKCNGLPLAVVTIGGFLANQPKTAVEWRKFNEHISAELEMNPELQPIKTVLNKSYDGLPYHLKSCFLYLSIFPEDHKVSRRRLVRRWTAEGYSREIRDKSAEEVADNYFMELIQRSMILPSQQSIHSKKGVASCQVHDLIREISISKSMEENLVFTLEGGCSLNSQGTVRHLAISSSWEGDQSDFESTVDMSRIRSLTVFGKWRSFFISEKMRLLRVLDLENASGLFDHHLDQIGKLLHLNYLSLRGCINIFYLPNSLGNLRQIKTLDVRGTRIIKLPKSIINLRKLQCLCAGHIPVDEDGFYEECVDDMPELVRDLLMLCVACFAPKVLKLDDDRTRRDACNIFCCFLLPIFAKHLDAFGVTVPRGIRKLKALHTLGVVNIAQGKPILQEIKRLTRLRKLGVTGVNKKNGEEFCSAIAGLSHLESLSVRSEGEPGLSGCLDGLSSPPENLQSLKLYGNLVKLPEWMKGLKNLVKLKLRSSWLSDHDAALEVLGKLPKLAILRLCKKSFEGAELRLYSHPEAFPGLMVLQLDGYYDLKSVKFEQGATPKLELLQVVRCWCIDETGISGLSSLRGLKQVQLEGSYRARFVEGVRTQLADNTNRPVLKGDYRIRIELPPPPPPPPTQSEAGAGAE